MHAHSGLYSHTSTAALTAPCTPSPSDTHLHNLRIAVTCLKSLRRLLAHGFKEIHVHTDLHALMARLVDDLSRCLHRRAEKPDEMLDKCIVKIGKIFLGTCARARVFTMRRGCAVPPAAVCLVTRLDRRCAGLLALDLRVRARRACAGGYAGGSHVRAVHRAGHDYPQEPDQTSGYVRVPANVLDFSQVNQKAYDVKHIRGIVDAQLFTPEFSTHMLQTLVPRLLALNKSDLESWMEDAESFCLEEDADHWEFNLRAYV